MMWHFYHTEVRIQSDIWPFDPAHGLWQTYNPPYHHNFALLCTLVQFLVYNNVTVLSKTCTRHKNGVLSSLFFLGKVTCWPENVLGKTVTVIKVPRSLAVLLLQSLQQKEREENEIKMKLEHEHSVLISKLVELGASGFVNSTSARSSPPPPGTTPTEIAAPNEGIPLALADDHLQQISPSPKDPGSHKGWQESIRVCVCVCVCVCVWVVYYAWTAVW